jgi:hypothetical protein
MYSAEDFIMEPEGLEMRIEGVKALLQVQKKNRFTSKTPGRGPACLPLNLAAVQF